MDKKLAPKSYQLYTQISENSKTAEQQTFFHCSKFSLMPKVAMHIMTHFIQNMTLLQNAREDHSCSGNKYPGTLH